MCDCIKKLKEKLQTEILKKDPDYSGLEIDFVQCDGETLFFQPTYTGISIPFTIYHEPVDRKKKTTVNMSTEYCPWCGKKYVEEDLETP